MQVQEVPGSISILNLLPPEKVNPFLKMCIRAVEKLVGISAMNKLYQDNEMQGLSKEAFAQKLINILQLDIKGIEAMQAKIPKEGPVVIASNHPFGGIEGVFLSLAISQVRPDLKVMANQALQIFPELAGFFIFTNPLSERDPKNGPSIRQTLKHVKDGNAVLIFPAGRTSYFHKDTKLIADHEWNRIVGRLVNASNAQYVPLFIEGLNSPLFYRLGRIYFRFRLLMLARELLNKQNAKVGIHTGSPVKASRFANETDLSEQAALCRALTYAQDPSWKVEWPADPVTQFKPLAADIPFDLLQKEIDELPANQKLLSYKNYNVYYGHQAQLPNVVKQIAKLRESVFREHNEGSGEPIDTDEFDASYTHLFAVNQTSQQIIGAYRMGRTDKLLEDNDLQQLYLSRMFNFGEGFANRRQPCLELGRSFLIPEYQRSFQGLYLLWRGIGAFVCKYPQYRTLYGTVSLSKLYDSRSIALIKAAMVTDQQHVTSHTPFSQQVHPEIAQFGQQYSLQKHLSSFLACIENDGKDIPILAKHYQKLGAVFHDVGIDSNFNNTPGLLLSVNLDHAPDKLLKLYMGDAYLEYKKAGAD